MGDERMKTPGVYIEEPDAFGKVVIQVPTAIPVFIGYTPRASYKGKSYVNKPVRIESLEEYLVFFGAMAKPTGDSAPVVGPPAAQCSPVYYPVAATGGEGDLELGGKEYSLVGDPGTLYYTYNAIRLFYENGGGTAYVVSVGPYGQPTGRPATARPYVNPNVRLNDLQDALRALANESEPTLIVVPEATLLSAANNGTLMQLALQECGLMKSRMAIFDVIGGSHPDPVLWTEEITDFRTRTGVDSLNYGIAYYPFLETTVMQAPDVSFLNFGGGVEALREILPGAGDDPVKALLGKAEKAQSPGEVERADQALRVASQEYERLHAALLGEMNVQPPSGAMAGVYALVDETEGVWVAPANVSIVAATAPTINLSDGQQADLNVDAMTGKSVNAIRLFRGQGLLVWGARTLDGNSQDWRYVNVRRTVMMIEQSARLAIQAYALSPNDAATWSSVSSMLNAFLTDLWKQGALAGSSASAAFSVEVGLGSTMTGSDILEGIMNVSLKVAVTHPAEFIVITISQEMQTS